MIARVWSSAVIILTLYTPASNAQDSCTIKEADDYLQQIVIFRQKGCYGGVRDTNQLTQQVRSVLEQWPDQQASNGNDEESSVLDSSRDQTQLIALISTIDLALNESIQSSTLPWFAIFATLSAEVDDVRDSIVDPARSVEAETWQWQNHTYFRAESTEPLIDYSGIIRKLCTSPDTLTSTCEAALRSAGDVVRYAELVRLVMLKPVYQRIDEILSLISALDDEWTYYFEEARSQYPWELAINDSRYDGAPNLLERPPKDQFILMHPTIAVEYVGGGIENEVAYETVAIVELVGYNRLRWKDDGPQSAWPIGISAIASYTPETIGDRGGYGFMVHIRNNFSIGATRRETELGDETTWLISVDLSKLFINKSQELRNRFRATDQSVRNEPE